MTTDVPLTVHLVGSPELTPATRTLCCGLRPVDFGEYSRLTTDPTAFNCGNPDDGRSLPIPTEAEEPSDDED